YDDLISYTDIFVGGNIKKHHGITRAVVGGVLAGPVGALVGAGTGGKEFTSIKQLGVMLHLPNNQTVKYMLITTETKTDSMIGKGLMDKYNELIAKLDQILKTNSSNKDNTVLSSADEIRKFKALLDDGIITKQEFEIKKRELLQ
ncbi:SHOCT domain-containing protein, partial [Enterococcus faecalis]|nr:SHOCT domain-containing protein [Enterococcus faecalis]EHQ2622977.1 SHOCT domain-containing protein [Enterococcus faecalis]